MELHINTDFFEAIDPPSSFPPSEDQLLQQVQSVFLKECEHFLSNERSFYKISKNVENKLTSIVKNAETIENRIKNQRETFEKLNIELNKIKSTQIKLNDRQQILSLLCQLIRMEQMREMLYLNQNHVKGEVEPQKSINEDLYLKNLNQLYEIIKDSTVFNQLKEEFSLISQIIIELKSIYEQALKQLLNKFLTPKMLNLILTKYYFLFRENQVELKHFGESVLNNRLQHFRISLNPMINNLNYAQNASQIYDLIFKRWASIIEEDLTLFAHCSREDIMKTATFEILNQLLPKMQKNVFRLKDMTQISIIRKSLHSFFVFLKQIQVWWANTSKNQMSKQFELIISFIKKCQTLIESKLSEEAEMLQSTKYNIYSLASYLPIRQHLQKIKLCQQNDIEENEIDWETAFYMLSSSREPKSYPNNKSLIIFNLNIWYLYLRIIRDGKYQKQGLATLRWCEDTFIALNIRQTQKEYHQSFDRILDLCGNLTDFKKKLYAEINLLGHQDLRLKVAKGIQQKWKEVYEKILIKIEKSQMTNEDVKEFCQNKKINLNKFGKFSNLICIYSPEKLYSLLEYQS